MPVLDEDYRKYDEFVLSIANELGSLDSPAPNTLLWHYTNGEAFLAILKSAQLYSTQVSCLNDSEEIKYASRLLKSSLEKMMADGDTDIKKLCEVAVKYFDADEDYPGTLPYFVTCFTELEDAISQWRGYSGRSENGYAIGFDPQALKHMGALMTRVNYDEKKHQELAVKVAKATMEFYRDGVNAKRADTPEQWGREFMTVWDEKITQLAPMVKNPCWCDEKEYRLVRQLFRGELPQLRIIQKDTMMTRHLPLKMTSDCCYPFLPIKEVIVGPSCPHPAITRVSVHTALRQYGYADVVVKSSVRPYRKT